MLTFIAAKSWKVYIFTQLLTKYRVNINNEIFRQNHTAVVLTWY